MTFVYYWLAHAPWTTQYLWFSGWHCNHTWRPTAQTIHWKPKQSSPSTLEGDICILQLAICLSINAHGCGMALTPCNTMWTKEPVGQPSCWMCFIIQAWHHTTGCLTDHPSSVGMHVFTATYITPPQGSWASTTLHKHSHFKKNKN